jgi:imidazolonepropionase-like amidohydrolase
MTTSNRNTLAIKGGRVDTITNGIIEKGIVIIENGKICAVGFNIDIPENCKVIDATNKWVTPGFIDAHSHIAVFGEIGPDLPYANEITNPITPHLRILDQFDPHDVGIPLVRAAGFTSCCSLPGSTNLIGGTGFAFKLKEAETVDEMVLPGTECMKFALGENPCFYIGAAQKKIPMTRMANAALLRETLINAQEYEKKLKTEKDPSKTPKPDIKLQALLPVIRGEMRVRIHAHAPKDIVTGIRIAEEFNLKYAIEHCTEGYKIAEYLAKKNPMIVTDFYLLGPYKKEVWGQSVLNPAILDEAGLTICLSRDSSSQTWLLPSSIGHGIARGRLKVETAMKAVTINPAKLLDIDHRIGSIEVGKDADIAIFTGDPFCNYTTCTHTIIDGEVYENYGEINWYYSTSRKAT